MGLPLPLDKQRQVPQAVSNLSAFVSGPFRVCHDRGTVQLAHLPRAVLNELKRLKLRLIANFGPSLCTGFSFTTGFAMALTAALMCDQVTLYGFTPTADAPPPLFALLALCVLRARVRDGDASMLGCRDDGISNCFDACARSTRDERRSVNAHRGEDHGKNAR